jgi:hypothetical protein
MPACQGLNWRDVPYSLLLTFKHRNTALEVADLGAMVEDAYDSKPY